MSGNNNILGCNMCPDISSFYVAYYMSLSGAIVAACAVGIGRPPWRSVARVALAVMPAYALFGLSAIPYLRRQADADLETVFDPGGHLGELADGVVLGLSLAAPAPSAPPDRGPDRLLLRCRVGALDAEATARIAGYHLTALELMAADPEAEHRSQSLLSPQERDFQIDGLAGPRRELPDRRFHELFEDRVVEHPDAIAAVFNDEQWTYRELNAKANQLARALLVRGLKAEDVVAVATERNLDWMAAVLAISLVGQVAPANAARQIEWQTLLPKLQPLKDPLANLTQEQRFDIETIQWARGLTKKQKLLVENQQGVEDAK